MKIPDALLFPLAVMFLSATPTLLHAQTAAPSASPARVTAKPPKIIIKIDDFRSTGDKKVSAEWQRVADFLKQRKIKANIGIICDSLEGDKPVYFQWIKDMQATGQIEFWLHAYDHKPWTAPDGTLYNEFSHRTVEEQTARFAKCQALAKEKLGFVFHTFGPPGTGAPGEGTDEATYKAIQADPDLRVWLYGSPMDDAARQLEALGKVTVLDRVWHANIEQPIFKPNAAAFQKGYEEYAAKRDYFVLQGHPGHWSQEGFDEFVKLVDYAQAQGCEFVTPSEYVAAAKKAADPKK